MLTAADKFIEKEQIEEIRTWIHMTKLEQLFYDEMKGPWEEKVAQAEARARVETEARAIAKKNMIQFMLNNGISEELIEQAKKEFLSS
jgi:hypothetical protein